MTEVHQYFNVYCEGCGKKHVVIMRCGDRFCPVCNAGRLALIREKLQFIVKNITLQPGERFRFLTFTVENQENLKQMCSFLIKKFRKLRESRFWKTYYQGGSYVIEVTGTQGNWHAHLHVLAAGYYCPQRLLLDAWRSQCGRGGVYCKNAEKGSTIRYILKYISKSECQGENQDLAASALKGYRLYQPFGSFMSVSKKFVRSCSVCPHCGSTAVIPEYKLYGVPFMRCVQTLSAKDPP